MKYLFLICLVFGCTAPDKEVMWEPDVYQGAPGSRGIIMKSLLGTQLIRCHEPIFAKYVCMGKSDADRLFSLCSDK